MACPPFLFGVWRSWLIFISHRGLMPSGGEPLAPTRRCRPTPSPQCHLRRRLPFHTERDCVSASEVTKCQPNRHNALCCPFFSTSTSSNNARARSSNIFSRGQSFRSCGFGRTHRYWARLTITPNLVGNLLWGLPNRWCSFYGASDWVAPFEGTSVYEHIPCALVVALYRLLVGTIFCLGPPTCYPPYPRSMVLP